MMIDLRTAPFRAWAQPAGPGIRRHFLVIPSVICAAQAATTIAEGASGAVAIEHQHGCSQLGGDARLTEQVLTGLGAHPNVAGALVVSLGCETVQGSALHRSIVGRGQRAEFVGIQQAGGTGAAIAAGREALRRLRSAAAADSEIGLDWSGLQIGVEGSWLDLPGAQARIFRDVIGRLCRLQATVVQAAPSAGEDTIAWWERRAPRETRSDSSRPIGVAYAARPAGAGFFVMESPPARIAQKTGLAAGGAHVILSPLVAGLPAGCPVAPVVHVGIAPYARPFASDVDLVLDEEPRDGAAAAVIEAIAAACRAETALESLGDFEMAIHRIAPTM